MTWENWSQLIEQTSFWEAKMKSLTEFNGQTRGTGTLIGSAYVSLPRRRNSANPAGSKILHTAPIFEIDYGINEDSNKRLRRRKMGGGDEGNLRVLALIQTSFSCYPFQPFLFLSFTLLFVLIYLQFLIFSVIFSEIWKIKLKL